MIKNPYKKRFSLLPVQTVIRNTLMEGRKKRHKLKLLILKLICIYLFIGNVWINHIFSKDDSDQPPPLRFDVKVNITKNLRNINRSNSENLMRESVSEPNKMLTKQYKAASQFNREWEVNGLDRGYHEEVDGEVINMTTLTDKSDHDMMNKESINLNYSETPKTINGVETSYYVHNSSTAKVALPESKRIKDPFPMTLPLPTEEFDSNNHNESVKREIGSKVSESLHLPMREYIHKTSSDKGKRLRDQFLEETKRKRLRLEDNNDQNSPKKIKTEKLRELCKSDEDIINSFPLEPDKLPWQMETLNDQIILENWKKAYSEAMKRIRETNFGGNILREKARNEIIQLKKERGRIYFDLCTEFKEISNQIVD